MLRKPPTREEEYATKAAEVLQKQHDRLVTIIEALLQAAGWMPSDALDPHELEMLEAARKFTQKSKQQAV